MKQCISAALAVGAATATAAIALCGPPATTAIPATAGPRAPEGPATAERPSGPCALGGITDNVAETAATPDGYARAHGTVRALTLFIDFPDARATITPRARFAEFFPAAAEFFHTSSYGRLVYRPAPLLKWLHMARPLAAYGIRRGAAFDPASDGGYHALSQEIVRAADASVDFRDYDIVNVIAAPNAGPAATRTVLSVTFSGSDLGLRTGDGVPFRNASFIWSRQPGPSPFRVINHENAHSFGLPDLYYTDGRNAPPAAGHWDPMDEDWGPANDFTGWHKWKLGWLGAGQVACAQPGGPAAEFTLTPMPSPGGTKIVVMPTSARTALVAEARTRGPLDPALCRPGVLVYRVATDVASGGGPLRVVDATPHSGGCLTGNRYVHAELTDAAFRPGATYTDPRSHAAVSVLARNPDGTYRIRIRPPDARTR
ncbi:M6 family metalloprotease domain-containing protein [Streptomyces pinistramenti]|uniref:M6 family metalloprotease domain-containing protein n=1 Tax=Streptomyces pinistramenti TaxID=2884812 RepID=UPI001D06E8ED|nr:M6 family metalloprotease domain-containing protein [Streptomyces pinistramenti]MCB5910179.1 M6 family metalloprotease domain-containing protein [Streptomyces pinistramenti]